VIESLAYGQALAALNCKFEGARGAIYQLPEKKSVERVTELQSRNAARKSRSEIERTSSDRIIPFKVCPSCLDYEQVPSEFLLFERTVFTGPKGLCDCKFKVTFHSKDTFADGGCASSGVSVQRRGQVFLLKRFTYATSVTLTALGITLRQGS